MYKQHLQGLLTPIKGGVRALLFAAKIQLDLDEPALTWLGNRGYDPAYGARPLKRVIQKSLQDPLASQILEGKVKDGDTVKVTVEDGQLSLNGEKSDAEDPIFATRPPTGDDGQPLVH